MYSRMRWDPERALQAEADRLHAAAFDALRAACEAAEEFIGSLVLDCGRPTWSLRDDPDVQALRESLQDALALAAQAGEV